MLGRGEEAEAELLGYLADSERQILEAYGTAGRTADACGPARLADHGPDGPDSPDRPGR